MGKLIYSITKKGKRIDILEDQVTKQLDERIDWRNIVESLEAMSPEDREAFIASLTPEQLQQLEQFQGTTEETEEQPEEAVQEEVVPEETERVPEELPVEEAAVEEPVEEEVPVDEARQPVEEDQEEVPVDEAGQPVTEEEQVPEEEVAEEPPIAGEGLTAEEPVAEEQPPIEEEPRPLQVVCPHCKRPVTLEQQQPQQNPIPGPLRPPEHEGNPY